MAAAPVLAHHSFSAEYDRSKPITVKGTVTKVEWMNPHARFYVDVKDDSGAVTNWEFELGSPNGLMREGWSRNSLKEGDVVTVSGSRQGWRQPGECESSRVRGRQARIRRRVLGRQSGHAIAGTSIAVRRGV
jgi:DNA/RNA endonuclease YhcR with UshA esterase domain